MTYVTTGPSTGNNFHKRKDFPSWVCPFDSDQVVRVRSLVRAQMNRRSVSVREECGAFHTRPPSRDLRNSEMEGVVGKRDGGVTARRHSDEGMRMREGTWESRIAGNSWR